MNLYLIVNNNLIDNLKYSDDAIDLVRTLRLLSIEGESDAKKISEMSNLSDIESIYSSYYASSIDSSKYLSEKYSLDINLDKRLNDCKVGILQGKNIKLVKNLQEHDFNYKLYNGESLNEVGLRMNSVIEEVVSNNENCALYTHKRSILGYFLRFASVGYNLDDELIIEYNNKVIYSTSDKLVEVYKLTFNNNKLEDVEIVL